MANEPRCLRGPETAAAPKGFQAATIRGDVLHAQMESEGQKERKREEHTRG